jgi:hypothetical protein
MLPVRLEPVPRLPRAPLWAALAVLGWAALAAGEIRLGLTTCLFKRVTGHPCPTCGATRGVLALLAGHPLEALAWNPLAFGVMGLGLAWFTFRAATGLAPRVAWNRHSGRIALAVATCAVLANWAYLWVRGI